MQIKNLNDIYKLCSELGIPFEVADEQKEIYDDIVKYFFNPKESCLDTKKGLFLAGKSGAGKTYLVKLLRYLIYLNKGSFGFPIKETGEIVSQIKMSLMQNDPEPFYSLLHLKHACFDEFGNTKHEVIKHFGNDLDIGFTIVEERHKRYMKHGLKSIFISNLELPEIKERFLDLHITRIREMCNVVAFKGENKRGKHNFSIDRFIEGEVRKKQEEAKKPKARTYDTEQLFEILEADYDIHFNNGEKVGFYEALAKEGLDKTYIDNETKKRLYVEARKQIYEEIIYMNEAERAEDKPFKYAMISIIKASPGGKQMIEDFMQECIEGNHKYNEENKCHVYAVTRAKQLAFDKIVDKIKEHTTNPKPKTLCNSSKSSLAETKIVS